MKPYVPRLVDSTLTSLLQELPALLLVGPRACGKTTSAARQARTLIGLDRPAESAVFRGGPGLQAAPISTLWVEV